jgi:hypothetical protein
MLNIVSAEMESMLKEREITAAEGLGSPIKAEKSQRFAGSVREAENPSPNSPAKVQECDL